MAGCALAGAPLSSVGSQLSGHVPREHSPWLVFSLPVAPENNVFLPRKHTNEKKDTSPQTHHGKNSDASRACRNPFPCHGRHARCAGVCRLRELLSPVYVPGALL
eukprot:86435-Rhodomonas_salina.1